jgi:hypothetical protein
VISFSVYIIVSIFIIVYIYLPWLTGIKEIKNFCFAKNIYTSFPDTLCIISFGQFSRGIISIGQLSIGIFCLGQGSISFFGIGQGSFSFFYTFLAQMAISPVINTCQLGLAWITTKRAQIATCPLNPFLKIND